MSLIVDTSVLVAAERSSASFKSDLLDLSQQQGFGISVISLGELSYGHLLNSRLSEAEKAQALSQVQSALTVYPVSAEIALRAGRLNAELRVAGKAIGLADVLIVSTALVLGFGVLTHNVRHFSYVSGLQVSDAAGL